MRLISILLFGLLVAEGADAQRGRHTQRILRGIRGEVLTRNGDFFSAVGGNPSGMATRASISNGKGMLPLGVYEVTLPNTPSGWEEKFLIGVPKSPLTPAPCLVVFHGYGEEHTDMVAKTTYFQEAMARGWIVIAPLAAHKYNYAIDYAQENAELALTWAATYLTLDPDRFYAVGFSMGGGMAASFAARHLDRYGPHFAAVAIHTGTCSIRDVYWSANDKTLLESPQMFGGNPDQVPFRYQTASTIDLDFSTNQVDPESDLVRNLVHTPLYHFAALNDPNPFLINETQQNHSQALVRHVPSSLVTSNDSVHQWYTLDETTVLDWLEPKTYQQVADGEAIQVLADRDGRWYDFEVTQSQSGGFTPFRWTVLQSMNRFYLDQIENAARIAVDPAKLGLDKDATVEFVVNNVDGTAIEIALEGYAQAPIDVRRAGVSTGAWSFDAATGTLTLYESDASTFPLWQIIP